ncbi:MAG: hypothetical protein SFT68_05975 [Rickettsiaceae bacterium]|nr:hypothetical protein [Rickettsiaceae bacterium]
MSFPRRWESSLTISWIPFYKGMTSGESSPQSSLPSPGYPFTRELPKIT